MVTPARQVSENSSDGDPIVGFVQGIGTGRNKKDERTKPVVGIDSFVSNSSSRFSRCLDLQNLIRRRWIQLASMATFVAAASAVVKRPLLGAAMEVGLGIGLGRSIGQLRSGYNALDCDYALQFPAGEPSHEEQGERVLRKLYSPHGDEYAWVPAERPAPVPLSVPLWQKRGLWDEILESNRRNAEWMLYGSAAVALYGLAWFVTADDGIPRGPGASDNFLAIPATVRADAYFRAAAEAFHTLF